LAGLGGGCRTPVAGHATLDGRRLTLAGLVGRPDASEMIRESLQGTPEEARALGAEVARRLIARGAGQILRELEGR
jgi:hydroxymethylbilane synthase